MKYLFSVKTLIPSHLAYVASIFLVWHGSYGTYTPTLVGQRSLDEAFSDEDNEKVKLEINIFSIFDLLQLELFLVGVKCCNSSSPESVKKLIEVESKKIVDQIIWAHFQVADQYARNIRQEIIAAYLEKLRVIQRQPFGQHTFDVVAQLSSALNSYESIGFIDHLTPDLNIQQNLHLDYMLGRILRSIIISMPGFIDLAVPNNSKIVCLSIFVATLFAFLSTICFFLFQISAVGQSVLAQSMLTFLSVVLVVLIVPSVLFLAHAIYVVRYFNQGTELLQSIASDESSIAVLLRLVGYQDAIDESLNLFNFLRPISELFEKIRQIENSVKVSVYSKDKLSTDFARIRYSVETLLHCPISFTPTAFTLLISDVTAQIYSGVSLLRWVFENSSVPSYPSLGAKITDILIYEELLVLARQLHIVCTDPKRFDIQSFFTDLLQIASDPITGQLMDTPVFCRWQPLDSDPVIAVCDKVNAESLVRQLGQGFKIMRVWGDLREMIVEYASDLKTLMGKSLTVEPKPNSLSAKFLSSVPEAVRMIIREETAKRDSMDTRIIIGAEGEDAAVAPFLSGQSSRGQSGLFFRGNTRSGAGDETALTGEPPTSGKLKLV